MRMLKIDSGEISVLNETISYEKTPKMAHKIGFMPQEVCLTPYLTVREILNYFGKITMMTTAEINAQCEKIFSLLKLPSEHLLIAQLSGGEKRRVSLAIAMIHDPLVLILDEPTVGLDVILRHEIWEFLSKFTKEHNRSVLMATHYLMEAEKADICGFIKNGKIIASGLPCQLAQRLQVERIDEAFLKLCQFKHESVIIQSDAVENIDMDEKVKRPTSCRFFNTEVIKAVLGLEFIRAKRKRL
jgi:ABC-type multidrug transport system ATPase subunit